MATHEVDAPGSAVPVGSAIGGGCALNPLKLWSVPGGEVGEARLKLDFGGDEGSAIRCRENEVYLKVVVAPIARQERVTQVGVVGEGGVFGFEASGSPGRGGQGPNQWIGGYGGARVKGVGVWHAPKLHRGRVASRG